MERHISHDMREEFFVGFRTNKKLLVSATFQEHAKGRGVLSTHVVPPYSEFLFLGKEIKNSLTDSYTKLCSLTDINYPMITENTGLPLAQKSPSFPVTGKRD